MLVALEFLAVNIELSLAIVRSGDALLVPLKSVTVYFNSVSTIRGEVIGGSTSICYWITSYPVLSSEFIRTLIDVLKPSC